MKDYVLQTGLEVDEEWRSPFVIPREGLEIEYVDNDTTAVLHSLCEDGDSITGIVSYPEIADVESEEFVIEKGTRLQASKEFILRNRLGIIVGLGGVTVSAASGFIVRKYFKNH